MTKNGHQKLWRKHFWEKVKFGKISAGSEHFFENRGGGSKTGENASFPEGGWTHLTRAAVIQETNRKVLLKWTELRPYSANVEK